MNNSTTLNLWHHVGKQIHKVQLSSMQRLEIELAEFFPPNAVPENLFPELLPHLQVPELVFSSTTTPSYFCRKKEPQPSQRHHPRINIRNNQITPRNSTSSSGPHQVMVFTKHHLQSVISSYYFQQ